MLLALDYDDTYTRDPEFWDRMIELAKSRGHSVICVTMRYESESKEVYASLSWQVDDIICTGRKAKQEFVSKKGYYPSVWIDDTPFFIVNDARV